MPINLLVRPFLLVAFAFLWHCASFAQDAGPTENASWQSLIAQDSLTGWKGDLNSWDVSDGVLVGRADGTLTANRFIVADIQPVANFELTVDVWVSAKGNSGIQYRSESREDLGPFVVTGYQCDVVAGNPDYNGMLYEERGRRIVAHTGEKVVVDATGTPWVVDTFEKRSFEPEQWHTYRVLVEGNHHHHWIDGHPTTDVIDLDEANRSLSGLIGFQVHVGPPMEIRYRNLKLRRLSGDLPLRTPADTPIASNATEVVPQGGWKQKGKRDANARLIPVDDATLPGAHEAGPVDLAGQPTKEQFELLRNRNITTVISLRGDGELAWDEQAMVESLGMNFVSIPISHPSDLDPTTLKRIRSLLSAAKSDERVLLHCASANRVGAVWMAHRVKDGRMTVDHAIKEAKRVGLRSEAFEKATLKAIIGNH